MKYAHKGARAVFEFILGAIKELPPLVAEEFANRILTEFLAIHPEAHKLGDICGDCRYISDDLVAVLFEGIICESVNFTDPGRPAPQERQLSDLLKDPTEAARIEAIIRQHVNTPPDLAALVEALSRLKKLTQEAANAAAVVRVAEGIIGRKRAGSARNLRENRARAATKGPGKEGKIGRKIGEFITILTQ